MELGSLGSAPPTTQMSLSEHYFCHFSPRFTMIQSDFVTSKSHQTFEILIADSDLVWP
jgi:hypothetical protein